MKTGDYLIIGGIAVVGVGGFLLWRYLEASKNEPGSITLVQQSHIENNWVGTAQLLDVYDEPIPWASIDVQYSKDSGTTWLHYTSDLTGADGIVEFTVSAPANLVAGNLVRCAYQNVISNVITVT